MGKTILMAFAGIVVILLFITFVFFVFCIIVSAIRYIYGEVIHTIRNAKKTTKDFMWEMEWKWNHR